MRHRFRWFAIGALLLIAIGSRAAAQDDDPAFSVAWHTDVIAVGGDGDITLVSPTLETLRRLSGHEGIVYDLAFSPDGERLASAGQDGTVRLWEVASGEALSMLEGHTDRVTVVAWSPVGDLIASGGDDGTIRLWNADTGTAAAVLEGHTAAIQALTWGTDSGVFYSAGADGTLRKWDAFAGWSESSQPANGFEGLEGIVLDLALSPDGAQLAGVGLDGRAWLWNAVSGTLQASTAANPDLILDAVAWNPRQEQLAVAYRDYTGAGGVTLWDSATLESLGIEVQGDGSGARHMAWGPDGLQLAMVGWDNTRSMWKWGEN